MTEFRDEAEAEESAEKMAAEKRKNALPQTAGFWRDCFEINGLLFYFVPDALKTDGQATLATLAVRRDGRALEFIDEAIRNAEICEDAVMNNPYALEYIPAKFKTKDLFFAAVKQDGRALSFVDVEKLSKSEYADLCRIAFESAANTKPWK
jgi:hypothetical protein